MTSECNEEILLSYLEGELTPDEESTVREALLGDHTLAQDCRALERILEAEEILRETRSSLDQTFVETVLGSLPERPGEPLHRLPTVFEQMLHAPIIDWMMERCSTLAMGMAVAACVAFVVSVKLLSQRSPSYGAVPVAQVLVPASDIPAGRELREDMFRREFRPVAQLTSEAVTSFDQIRGEYSRALMVAGYAVDRRYTSAPRFNSRFGIIIPAGYRVVAIPVRVNTADFSFQPGGPVDVVLVQKEGADRELYRLVSDAQVLSITNDHNTDSTTHYVTLLVQATEAAKIDLARASGDLLLGTPLGHASST